MCMCCGNPMSSMFTMPMGVMPMMSMPMMSMGMDMTAMPSTFPMTKDMERQQLQFQQQQLNIMKQNTERLLESINKSLAEVEEGIKSLDAPGSTKK